jgi:hypothetical protein
MGLIFGIVIVAGFFYFANNRNMDWRGGLMNNNHWHAGPPPLLIIAGFGVLLLMMTHLLPLLILATVFALLLSPGGRGGIHGQHEGAVGEEALEHRQVELEDPVEAEATRDSLVGERGIDVAVADHVRAPVEGGADHLGNVLCPGSREQRRLRPRGHRRPVQHQLANALSELGPTRLAGGHDLPPERGQVLLEQTSLRRLARAVDAFEGDEHA